MTFDTKISERFSLSLAVVFLIALSIFAANSITRVTFDREIAVIMDDSEL